MVTATALNPLLPGKGESVAEANGWFFAIVRRFPEIVWNDGDCQGARFTQPEELDDITVPLEVCIVCHRTRGWCKVKELTPAKVSKFCRARWIRALRHLFVTYRMSAVATKVPILEWTGPGSAIS